MDSIRNVGVQPPPTSHQATVTPAPAAARDSDGDHDGSAGPAPAATPPGVGANLDTKA